MAIFSQDEELKASALHQRHAARGHLVNAERDKRRNAWAKNDVLGQRRAVQHSNRRTDVAVLYLEHADRVGEAACVEGRELQPHAAASIGRHQPRAARARVVR